MAWLESVRTRAVRHPVEAQIIAIVSLILLSLLHYRIIFWWIPADPDQLNGLSMGTLADPQRFFTHQILELLPVYRPIYALRFWLQYQIHGIDHVYLYQLVQLAFLLFAATLMFLALRALTGRLDAPLVAALAFTIDKRNQPAMTWHDPLAMAVAFGTSALWLLYRRTPGLLSCIAAVILLLMSGMSKEFGLAFTAFIGIESAWRLVIRRDGAALKYFIIAAAVTVIYLSLRILLAHGAASEHCAGSGYFWTSSDFCFKVGLIGEQFPQLLYNIGASFVGIFLPVLFKPSGELTLLSDLSLPYVAYCALFIGLALYALVRGSREAWLAILLMVCSAVISFALFRDRNHMVGEVGFYFAAGIGLALLLDRIASYRVVLGVLTIMSVSMIGYAVRAERTLEDHLARILSTDYCAKNAEEKHIDKTLARAIDARYRPWMPPCPGQPAAK